MDEQLEAFKSQLPKASRCSDQTLQRVAKMREFFQNDVFTVAEVRELFETTEGIAIHLLTTARKNKFIHQIATLEQIAEEADFGDRRPASVYSFDATKTLEDAIDYFDPEIVPKDKITLDVQLVGDYYLRYLDVRNSKIIHYKKEF